MILVSFALPLRGAVPLSGCWLLNLKPPELWDGRIGGRQPEGRTFGQWGFADNAPRRRGRNPDCRGHRLYREHRGVGEWNGTPNHL